MAKNKLGRRKFIQSAAAATAATVAFTSCSTLTELGGERKPSSSADWQIDESDKFDFIVVGSGAGGGPLAAGLAKEGFTVLLIEAGGEKNNAMSSTPAFSTVASEDPLLNWTYFVDRYADNSLNKRFEFLNSKFRRNQGVYYPRAAGLGGCTRANALISLYPDHQDWDHLVNVTGDKSWNSKDMFQRFNNIQKQNGGWLNLDQANPLTLLEDFYLSWMALKVIKYDAIDTLASTASDILHLDPTFIKEQLAKTLNILKLDPNAPAYVNNKYNGFFNVPFNATNGIRTGVREHILNTQRQYDKKLLIKTETLCTRVLFDQNDKTKAVGIEFIEGAHAYKADVMNQVSAKSSYVRKKAYAAKEVILAGGAFNTPQLLMLSGVGPANDIPNSIPIIKNLPGVGRNLQDRYEVTVVSELQRPISLLKDCTFARNNNFKDDPCWQDYVKNPGKHIYGTNGVVLSLIRKSSRKQASPDLCIFGVPGNFTGYYPGYSKDTTPKKAGDPHYFSWGILKGHTKNHAGRVTLKSDDPRDTPKINFSYFSDTNKAGMSEDLEAVFQGLKVARNLNKKIGPLFLDHEVYPGSAVKTDDDIKSWIKKESWGHHASCTSKMGPASDPMAVVDSKFKVHGLQNLRIVDASVFADIPGLFIMVPTLVASEKAREEIIKEHRS